MSRMSPFEALFVNSYFDYLLHKVMGLERLLRIAVNSIPRRIVEIGCGSGITTRILAERYPNAEITAIDVDEAQIARAEKRVVTENVRFVQGDATCLNLPSGSFDACFASYALHHIPAFPEALREIHRVLLPGGHLYVLEVPVSWEIIRQTANAWRREPLDGSRPSSLFTKKHLLREIERAGFRVTLRRGLLHVYLSCDRV